MRRIVVAAVGLLVAVGAWGAGATTVQAHAELEESSPLDGEMLTALPTVIELTFTEPIGKPADLVLLDPSGGPVPLEPTKTLDRVMLAMVPAGTPAADGWYSINYQVTSADGHLVQSTLRFMVHGDGNTEMPEAPGGVPTGTAVDADPIVVGALVGGLAAVLIYALAAIRRLLINVPRSDA